MRTFFVQGKEILVDDEDYEKVIKFKYYINYRNSVMKNASKKDKHRSLHRLIMNAPQHMEVDHINRNPLDNRKCNLRLCSVAENRQNVSKNRGKSKYKGVHWDKRSNKWRAEIWVNRKHLRLGRFDCELDAAKAYDTAAKLYHKDFAWLNLQD